MKESSPQVLVSQSKDAHYNVQTSNPEASNTSENLVQGFGELQQKKDSTSTPWTRKTQSVELPSHDSGFSETTFNLDGDSQRLTFLQTSLDVEPNVYDRNIIPTAISEHSETTSTNNVGDGTRNALKVGGLLKMQAYFRKLKQICPTEKQIGRNIGIEKYDILLELHQRAVPCLAVILKHLSDVDLLNCAQVSRDWSKLLDSNLESKQRLMSLRKIKEQIGKENTSPTKEELSSPRTSPGIPLGLIHTTCNILPQQTKSETTEYPATKWERFLHEGKKLKSGEKLTKCIRCSAPAKLLEADTRATCTMTGCRFDYCTFCSLEYHGGRDCSTQTNKKVRTDSKAINSKKSKKSLRRNL